MQPAATLASLARQECGIAGHGGLSQGYAPLSNEAIGRIDRIQAMSSRHPSGIPGLACSLHRSLEQDKLLNIYHIVGTLLCAQNDAAYNSLISLQLYMSQVGCIDDIQLQRASTFLSSPAAP